MKPKERIKWERIRAKGMWRFVLLYGVLLWGGAMIITTSAYGFFFRRQKYSLEDLSITVPAFLIGGFLFGLAHWFTSESRCQKGTGNNS